MNSSSPTLARFLSATLFVTFSIGSGPAQQIDPRATEISGFRSWRKATSRPMFMAPGVAKLCRQAPEFAYPTPHVPTYFQVFVNKTGVQAMFARNRKPFPVGSVIVKEKRRILPGTERLGPPELYTVMIKRKAGFDSVNGDWEFFVCDGQARPVRKASSVKHCQSCHQSRKLDDFTFRDYVRK